MALANKGESKWVTGGMFAGIMAVMTTMLGITIRYSCIVTARITRTWHC